MNFVRFLENHYQELTFKNESHKDQFNIVIDSEIKATHQVLTFYRWAMKWILTPKVFMNFLLVNLKLKAEPEPVLLNRMKKEVETKKVAQELEKEGKVKKLKTESTPPSHAGSKTE